jgi:hypothetical protein
MPCVAREWPPSVPDFHWRTRGLARRGLAEPLARGLSPGVLVGKEEAWGKAAVLVLPPRPGVVGEAGAKECGRARRRPPRQPRSRRGRQHGEHRMGRVLQPWGMQTSRPLPSSGRRLSPRRIPSRPGPLQPRHGSHDAASQNIALARSDVIVPDRLAQHSIQSAGSKGSPTHVFRGLASFLSSNTKQRLRERRYPGTLTQGVRARRRLPDSIDGKRNWRYSYLYSEVSAVPSVRSKSAGPALCTGWVP